MTQLTTVGWCENIALPELGIELIQAKIDTGARTSALHTYFIEPFHHKDKQKIRFGIHPLQLDNETCVICEAEVVDKRYVTDSGGRSEERYTIKTSLALAHHVRDVEITLTNRDNLKFRMLVGRTSLENLFQVDPSQSYIAGNPIL